MTWRLHSLIGTVAIVVAVKVAAAVRVAAAAVKVADAASPIRGAVELLNCFQRIGDFGRLFPGPGESGLGSRAPL